MHCRRGPDGEEVIGDQLAVFVDGPGVGLGAGDVVTRAEAFLGGGGGVRILGVPCLGS